MGDEWICDKTQTFTVANAVNVEFVKSEILSEDGTKIIRSLEGVKNFDYKYIVKNNNAAAQDIVVIAALFNENGKFQQAKVSEVTNVAAGGTATGTLEFFGSTAAKDGYYVKVFAVDKPKTLNPLSFVDAILRKQ